MRIWTTAIRKTCSPIARASASCRFLAAREAHALLLEWGIAPERTEVAREEWMELSPRFRVHAVPAAHAGVERSAEGESRFLGYVFEVGQRRIYHAGDTSPNDEVFAAVRSLLPIDVALLPHRCCAAGVLVRHPSEEPS
jgi:L-ascorbate metabolism protein UlaG (beta-lactamase superfamily)